MDYRTLGDIAREYNIAYHTLFHRMRSRDVPHMRVGERMLLIHSDHISRLVEPARRRENECSS